MSQRRIDYKRLGIVIAIPVFVIVLLIITVMMIMNSFKTRLDVLPEVRVEVGEQIILEPSLFMANSMSAEETAKVNMSSRLLKNEQLYTYNSSTHEVTSKGRKYLETGTYPVTFKLGNKEAESKLVVEDTKAPEIHEVEGTHRTSIGTSSYDYTSLVNIYDYSDFDVDINSSNVDLNTEGRYTITYSARDEYGNTSSATVDLLVGNADYSSLVEEKNDPVNIPGYATEEDEPEPDRRPTTHDTDFWDKLLNEEDDEDTPGTPGTPEPADKEIKDWRDKYKDKQNSEKETATATEIKGVNTEMDSKGRVKSLTAPSTTEADAYIKANIEGKVHVNWGISNIEGGVRYDFTYPD